MRERIEASERRPNENRRAAPIVAGVSAAACVALWAVIRGPSPEEASPTVGVVLASLGILAELLAYYEKGKDKVGSAALIPYAAALLVYPDWRVVALITAFQVIVQAWHRRSAVKTAFNIAQLSLSLSCALLIQRLLTSPTGGLAGESFPDAIRTTLLPAAGSVATQSVVNALCISAIISAVSGAKFWDLLREGTKRMGVLTGLQVVFVAYLAWLSVNLGWIGALGMALPILALRQLTKTTVELTNVTEELLDLMVAAIEARDPYTSGHSKRVAETSVHIARALGLREAEVERVQVAALLHDVGKIHEEFARILAKEGRLTPEEWEIMKRHPVRSAELVGLVTTLRDVVPAVRHHHENWDGTGYPDRISGASIPLASRIIMFADTLDAITTDRPYRKALDPEEARREFIKFRGKQFDPEICEVVVSPEVWSQLYESAKVPKGRDETARPSPVPVVA